MWARAIAGTISAARTAIARITLSPSNSRCAAPPHRDRHALARLGCTRAARLRLDRGRLGLRRLASRRCGWPRRATGSRVLECGRRFARRGLRRVGLANRAATSGCRSSGMRGIFRMTFFKDVFVVSGSGVGGGSLGYANTLYRARPAFFEDPQWAELADWEAELRAPLRHRRADARRRRLRGDGPGRRAAAASTARRSASATPSPTPGSASSSASPARRSPTPTSAARARAAPAACAAAAAWSAAATAPRTRWSRTTSGSPRSSASRSSPSAR